MDNNTVISQLADEVDNLFHIYQGLAAHIEDESRSNARLRSQDVSKLAAAIQRMAAHIQTLSRQISPDQTQNVRPESDKTYTITYSDAGWRVRFQPNIAPHFGMEPSRSLREVIERVDKLHPEYRPRLTSSQLEDYASELNDLVDIHGYEVFVPHAVGALMRCAPPDMPPSKRITLQEDAKSAFETGVGLPNVIKQLGSQQQTHQLSQHQLTEIEHNKQQNQTYQKAHTL
jgi:hypothetical protein